MNTPARLQSVGVVDDMWDVVLFARLTHKNLPRPDVFTCRGEWIGSNSGRRREKETERTTSSGTLGAKQDVVVATHNMLDTPLY